jgi:hypothetical protein
VEAAGVAAAVVENGDPCLLNIGKSLNFDRNMQELKNSSQKLLTWHEVIFQDVKRKKT